MTPNPGKARSLICSSILAFASFAGHAQSPPALDIDLTSDSQIRLSWPDTPAGILLEASATLSPSLWQPFPQTPLLADERFSVLVDISERSHFFRLHQLDTTGLPPDPATVASPIPTGVALPLARATEFLYAGPEAIQTGVADGVIETRRAAVLRGRVKQRGNSPLSGVTVSILNRPEFGQTVSRADGAFDLAVNGGGLLTLQYEKTSFCPVQRQAHVPWQDYATVEDVVMIQMDPIATTIALGPNSPMQVHQSSVQIDTAGSRQSTLLFTPGTCGSLVLPDGTMLDCASMSVRATEFTVGPNGPAAMPGALPATSGYTYCVELSADEAVAEDASVRFDRPVINYVDNFLGFPVGTGVPSGSYDSRRGFWVPEQNGKVIKILSITDGLAELDTDGDELPDSGASLAALSITAAERQQLAGLYNPGQSLWRVPVTHFTPFDYNWPIAPPPDAIQPPEDPAPEAPLDNCCQLSGNSVIETENQVLGEAIAVAGTGFGLHYRSDRAPGYKAAYTLEIPLSGTSLPASAQSIELEIEIAGRRFAQSFPATPDQSARFTWDRRDAYGRMLDGAQPITVNISYTYDAVYVETTGFAAPPAQASGTATLAPSRLQYRYTRIAPALIGTLGASSAGLGGWTLGPHHAYDPKAMVLYRGDGRRESAGAKDLTGPMITRVAGTGSLRSTFSGDNGPATEAQVYPQGIAVGPDGSLYIASPFAKRVRRVDPDGIITTVAGSGGQCPSGAEACGDAGPAVEAQLSQPWAVAVGADNSFFIAERGPGHRVRKVDTNGIITTVAGTGTSGFSGDGGPAPLAQISDPRSIAVGPDGALYIGELSRIRRVGPDGVITTVAGGGSGAGCGPPLWVCGDGGPATQATLNSVIGMAIGGDNSIYIAELSSGRIRRVTPDGIIQTIAGGGTSSADGVEATRAALNPKAVAVGSDDTVVVYDNFGKIRSFRPGGLISTVAGTVTGVANGDGGPARRAIIDSNAENSLAFGPDGSLYLSEINTARQVRRIAPVGEHFVSGNLVVPAADGSEVFVFTPEGQHLRTVDALTGALRYQFSYDQAGQLSSITDLNGNATTINRGGNGRPLGVLGPFGQITTLDLDANGFLSEVTNPAGESVQIGYAPGGALLAAFTRPGGQTSSYGYDTLGRLVSAADPTGATKTLSRTGSNRDHTVTVTTALGRVTTFKASRDSNQDLRLTTIDAAGAESHLLISQKGSQTSTQKDGTVVSLDLGPDPRWGMRAPIPTNLTITAPGGLTLTSTLQRVVTLASPGALLDLSTLTNTLTVNGRVSTAAYDASTRSLTYTWPTGLQQTIVLDPQGRMAQGQLGDLEPTSFAYDQQGRLTSTTAGAAENARSTAFAYAPSGFLESITDPLGRRFALSYDAVGRLTELTRPGGAVFGLAYDPNGNVASVKPSGQPSHLFSHDERDDGSSYTAPPVGAEDTQTTVTYSADRVPASVRRPGGETSTLEYDDAGRISVGALPTGQQTYAYDSASRLISLGTSQGIDLTYSYDGWLSTGVTWTGPVPGSVNRTYDSDFRLSELKVNGADGIAILYDIDGMPARVGDLVLNRDSRSALVTGTALGAITEEFAYDGFVDVVSYEAKHDGTGLYSITCSRDQLGRIVTRTETINGTTHAFGFAYDLDGRLSEVRRNTVLVAEYAYDDNGNRTSFAGTDRTVSAEYDAQDRLIEYGGTTYAYTPAGDLMRKTTAAQSTTYDYDGASRLAGLTLPNGTRIDYLLDGRGRRVGKRIDGDLMQAFLYQDGLRPIAELDGAGTVISRFVYAGGDTVPAYFVRDGNTYRIVTDQIGSPRMVVDIVTGQIMQRMDYDEFGVVTLDSNPGFQPFGFAGGLYDPLSGFVHFGAREYDAETGRWIVKDPSGFLGGPNLYAYAYNDPVNLIDPLGKAPFRRHPPYPATPPPSAVPPSPTPAPVAAPAPAPPTPPTPVPPSAAPPPRPFTISAPGGPSQPLVVHQPPLANVPSPQRPVLEPPCGGGPRVTPAAAVNVLFAFFVGYSIGTWLNYEFDLSGKAADQGIRARDAFDAAGFPEEVADTVGGLITIGASIGAVRFAF